jgi:hypothetical protein
MVSFVGSDYSLLIYGAATTGVLGSALASNMAVTTSGSERPRIVPTGS